VLESGKPQVPFKLKFATHKRGKEDEKERDLNSIVYSAKTVFYTPIYTLLLLELTLRPPLAARGG
jgi:hypothetical protein